MNKSVPEQQILDAALKIIIEHGYAGATTRQIAEEAGVNEVTLFRRFGSKKNMLLASVERQLAEFAEEGIHYSGNLTADLTQITTFHLRMSKHRGKLFPVLMAELPRQPELLEVVQKPLEAMLQIRAIIERYQDEGKLIKEDPFYTVANLIGPLILHEMLVEMHGHTFAAEIDVDHHVKTFLQGRGL